jgi:hypothetical protein
LKFLPADAAVMLAIGRPGWRLEHYLAADLFHVTAGQPHPWLPAIEAPPDPQRERKIREARIRLRERERAIAAGDITTPRKGGESP